MQSTGFGLGTIGTKKKAPAISNNAIAKNCCPKLIYVYIKFLNSIYYVYFVNSSIWIILSA